MNQENQKKLACATFATASASLLQSSILALIIFKKGFHTPYRRLIFAISVSDILQCIGLILGPFTIPVSTSQGFWAFGDRASCSFSGSLFTFGFAWSPMYTMALVIYYFFKLHKNMTDFRFANFIEKYLHLIFIAFMFICQTIALTNDAINSNVIGTFCLYSATPVGCRQAPNVFGECDDNKDLITNLNLAVVISVPFICLTCIVSILSFLLYKIAAREKIFSSLPLTHAQSNKMGQVMHIRKSDRISWLKVSSTGGSSDKNGKEYKTKPSKPCLKDEPNIVGDSVCSQPQAALEGAEFVPKKDNIQQNSALDEALLVNTNVKEVSEIRALRTKRPSSSTNSQSRVASSTKQSQIMARMYRKEMFVQVVLYSCQFIFTNILFSVMNLLLVLGKPPHFAFLFASQTLQPLSGVLNIFIFSRPSVCVMRARFPGMSWPRAFWIVFRNGGEAPKQETSPVIGDSSSKAMSSVQFGVANDNNLVSSAGGNLSFDNHESSCAQFYQIDYKNKLGEIQMVLPSKNGCEGKEDIQNTTNVPQMEDEERISLPDVTSTPLVEGYDSEGLTCKSSPLEDIVRKPELNRRSKEDQGSTSKFVAPHTNDDSLRDLMQTSSMNTCTERKNDWVYEKAAQDKVVFVESISQNIEESFSAYDMSYLSNVSDGDDEKLRSFGSDR